MSLVFDIAPQTRREAIHRNDVVCFIGFVARRKTTPLPSSVRSALRAGGWAPEGVWATSAARIEALENLPVVLESWAQFDALYAWDERPLDESGERHCASYLGDAVRSFFTRGGRRAVIIRVDDPWPYLETASQRAARRRARLRKILPDFAFNTSAAVAPFAPHDPTSWQGIQHLYALHDVALLVLPDLADACTFEPPLPDLSVVPAPPSAQFVECSEEAPIRLDSGLRALPAPRLDGRGYGAWKLAVSAASEFLRRFQREVLLLAALPLPDASTGRRVGDTRVHAQADMLAYLRRVGVLGDDGSSALGSAFIQLAWPWLRTQVSEDLPEGLASPDGVLAGLIANSTVLRGCFHSAAGDKSQPALRDIRGAEPLPSWGLGVDSPTTRLARHVCVLAQSPDGWALQSDVTTASQEAWRFGGASRLMSSILRAARQLGEPLCFEPNNEQLWARLRQLLEGLLNGYWRVGAFAGASAEEAFSVRCDRSTMTQNDIDNGRVRVEISVRPALSIEHITVFLDLGNAPLSSPVGVAA